VKKTCEKRDFVKDKNLIIVLFEILQNLKREEVNGIMIKARIGLSLLSILVALSLMAGATFAFFNDTATSTGNTFSTGNASLLIATDTGEGLPADGEFSESIAGPIIDNLFPGSSDRFLFWLKNDSSSDIELDLTADIASVDPSYLGH